MSYRLALLAVLACAGCGSAGAGEKPVLSCQREWNASVAWARAHVPNARVLQAAEHRYAVRVGSRRKACSETGG